MKYAQLCRSALILTSTTWEGPDIASLPRNTTITVWTYSDSFEDFRRIKEDLFAQGFETAGRALPSGVPIGGAPDGTRSAAQ